MSDAPLNTVQLRAYVERWQNGDRAAADELLRIAGARLEQLGRRMLRGFPHVRSQVETGDVLQGSLVRLLNALQSLSPNSTQHFFNLAALHIRRELLDLARHFGARGGRQSLAGADIHDAAAGGIEMADATSESAEELELWCRFHEAVDRLAVEEREVIGLLFYHGWAQVQVAELIQVDVRTVRRRWQSACQNLHVLLGGQLPPL
jgi:RNA polymerase sigma-70 factor (ECF subfamily)